MSGYAVGAAVGAIAGIVLSFLALRRHGSSRRPGVRDVPPVVALVISVALAGAMLVWLRAETRRFVAANLVEAGRRSPALPPALISAARETLAPGETWKLITPGGQCRDDADRYYWLAFHLLPNVAECDGTPTIVALYRIEPQILGAGSVVAQGDDWAVVRP